MASKTRTGYNSGYWTASGFYDFQETHSSDNGTYGNIYATVSDSNYRCVAMVGFVKMTTIIGNTNITSWDDFNFKKIKLYLKTSSGGSTISNSKGWTVGIAKSFDYPTSHGSSANTVKPHPMIEEYCQAWDTNMLLQNRGSTSATSSTTFEKSAAVEFDLTSLFTQLLNGQNGTLTMNSYFDILFCINETNKADWRFMGCAASDDTGQASIYVESDTDDFTYPIIDKTISFYNSSGVLQTGVPYYYDTSQGDWIKCVANYYDTSIGDWKECNSTI